MCWCQQIMEKIVEKKWQLKNFLDWCSYKFSSYGKEGTQQWTMEENKKTNKGWKEMYGGNIAADRAKFIHWLA